MDVFLSGITREHGREAAATLATAYEAAILASSGGDLRRMPDRSTRMRFVEAMLAEGRRHGFQVDRLTGAALASA